MRALNVFLAILVSFVIGTLVFECGLRLFPAFRPTKTVNEFDAQLGWSKKPGTTIGRKTGEFNIEFEINELGLRDDKIESAKTDAFRVVCLGDSFTLGYTVDREHLFVDHLERYWGSQQRRIEVINAGTEGYSTDQSALWFQQEGKALQPDLVLLFPYENDIYWNGQQQYQSYPKPRFTSQGAIEARGLVKPAPKSFLTKFALGNFATKVLRPLIVKRDPSIGAFQPAGTEVWIQNEFAPLLIQKPDFLADCESRTVGCLTALKRDCEAIGAKLIVVPIPSESVIDPEEKERFRELAMGGLGDEHWSPDQPVDFFLSAAANLGLDVIDARRDLLAAQTEGEKLYFEQEWHFTPAGNEAFALTLIEKLDQASAFPEEHRALATALGTGSFEVAEDPVRFSAWMILFAGLWTVLGTAFCFTYPKDNKLVSILGVGAMLTLVFSIFTGVQKLLEIAGPRGPQVLLALAAIILGFVVYKLGRRIGTILELLRAFTLRGHWYLMPLVVVLLSIGSLLVVAASSPLIAPFIYTLF